MLAILQCLKRQIVMCVNGGHYSDDIKLRVCQHRIYIGSNLNSRENTLNLLKRLLAQVGADNVIHTGIGGKVPDNIWPPVADANDTNIHLSSPLFMIGGV